MILGGSYMNDAEKMMDEKYDSIARYKEKEK